MWRRSEPIHTSYCQAQPNPRPKLGAELVLISNNPAAPRPQSLWFKALTWTLEDRSQECHKAKVI